MISYLLFYSLCIIQPRVIGRQSLKVKPSQLKLALQNYEDAVRKCADRVALETR